MLPVREKLAGAKRQLAHIDGARGGPISKDVDKFIPRVAGVALHMTPLEIPARSLRRSDAAGNSSDVHELGVAEASPNVAFIDAMLSPLTDTIGSIGTWATQNRAKQRAVTSATK